MKMEILAKIEGITKETHVCWLLEFTKDEVTYEDQDVVNLVVYCSMLGSKILKGQWRRDNIFRTKCTTNGRLCSVISNGGSYENMVSK